jgi:hypothetical protein
MRRWGLKSFVSSSSKMDEQVTDEAFGERMQRLGNGLQNWVITGFRRAKIGMLLSILCLGLGLQDLTVRCCQSTFLLSLIQDTLRGDVVNFLQLEEKIDYCSRPFSGWQLRKIEVAILNVVVVEAWVVKFVTFPARRQQLK